MTLKEGSRRPGRGVLPLAVGRSVSHPLPKVGLGMASHGEPLGLGNRAAQALELAHLRVHLILSPTSVQHACDSSG